MAEKKKDAPPPGTNKKKLYTIIAAAVLLVAAVAGAAAYFFLRTPAETGEPKETAIPGLTEQATVGPMVNVDEFIVNIISGDAPHYVKASLSLELTNLAVVDEVNLRMPQIRDSILLLIGNKTFEELQDLQGKKQLKAEMQTRINAFLQTGKVQSIYFTNFVVQ